MPARATLDPGPTVNKIPGRNPKRTWTASNRNVAVDLPVQLRGRTGMGDQHGQRRADGSNSATHEGNPTEIWTTCATRLPVSYTRG